MAKCRSCGAEIIWTKTLSGKSMPVDAEPSPDGNIMIGDTGVACVMSGLELEHYRAGADIDDNDLHLSHFITCPHASQHRKPRASERAADEAQEDLERVKRGERL